MSGRTGVRSPARGVAVALLALVVGAPRAEARRDRTVTGDVIKAARFLQTVAARRRARRCSPISRSARPTRAEVKWLRGRARVPDRRLRGRGQAARQAPGRRGRRPGRRRPRKLAASTLVGDRDVRRDEVAEGALRHPLRARARTRRSPSSPARCSTRRGRRSASDLGLKPTDPIRVELLGAPADLAKLSPLTEARDRDHRDDRAVEVQQADGRLAARDDLRLPVDGHARPRVHAPASCRGVAHDTVPVWLQEGLARFEQTRWRRPPEVVLAATEQALLATGAQEGPADHASTRCTRRWRSCRARRRPRSPTPRSTRSSAGCTSKVGYKGIRDALVAQRDGKSARRAVAEALGMPWPAVEKEWRAHLKATDRAEPTRPRGRQADQVRQGRRRLRERRPRAGQRPGPQARPARRHAARARACSRPRPSSTRRRSRRADRIRSSPASSPGPWSSSARHERAIELATPLTAADDRDAVAAVTLGMARSARHEWPEAIAAYEQALRVSPFDPTTRCGLAEAYAEISDPRAARERTRL